MVARHCIHVIYHMYCASVQHIEEDNGLKRAKGEREKSQRQEKQGVLIKFPL